MYYKKLFRGSILFFFLLISFFAHSQLPSTGGGGKAKRNEKDFSFMPIPYINYDRTLGFSVGFLPIAMYNMGKKDTISPSSISGAFGMYTSNKSWFALQFNKLYFSEDRYRALFAFGTGKFNSQFFLDLPFIENYVDYSTAASFIKAELQRKIFPNFYLGLNYSHAKLFTELPATPSVKEEVFLDGLGAVVSYDVRDNVYYPRKGFFSNLNFTSFPGFMGNTYISNKIILDYNHFLGMKNKRDVIGMRLHAGAGIGDLSFNQQFIVGNNDIRGYTQGKYRGDQIVTMQGEYRLNPFKKLGFIGYAGLASVFSGINAADNGKILPAIGTGFRYIIFPKNHMNAGIDVAVGIQDWGMYFKIGESF